jgi:hypothetical protein
MAIEVDYFAFDRRQASNPKWNSDYYEYTYSNAEKFGFAEDNSYIRNAVVIASIFYKRLSLVPACYIFLAENENSPIKKLVRVSWFYLHPLKNFHYLDEIDVDEKTAQEFHQDFSQLPSPRKALIEYLPSVLDGYDFQLDLGRIYGGNTYQEGTGYSHFDFAEAGAYKIFDASFKRILQLCQALTPHRHPDTATIREAIRAYEAAHRSKAEAVKTYRGIKPKKSKVLSSDKKLLEDYRSRNLKMQENFLDFKHYLQRFLEFIVFDRQSSTEHETILFNNLEKMDLLTWDEDEQKAINDYFLALFKYSLSYYPSISVSTSTILLWLIKLGLDMQPFLDYWESSFEHVDSLRHLGAFLENMIEENLVDNLPRALSDWLAQAKLEKALSDAISSYQGKRPYAHEFLSALENLRLIRPS